MKIGVIGTSADPPTKGHLWLINHIIEVTNIDKIIIRLCGSRPDKKYNASNNDRINMMGLFTRSIPYWKITIDYRDVFKENTPTIIMLEEIQTENPNDKIIFITGDDVDITKWYKGEELLTKWKIIKIPRTGNISSTLVRNMIKNNESSIQVSEYITPEVEDYIYHMKLYR